MFSTMRSRVKWVARLTVHPEFYVMLMCAESDIAAALEAAEIPMADMTVSLATVEERQTHWVRNLRTFIYDGEKGHWNDNVVQRRQVEGA